MARNIINGKIISILARNKLTKRRKSTLKMLLPKCLTLNKDPNNINRLSRTSILGNQVLWKIHISEVGSSPILDLARLLQSLIKEAVLTHCTLMKRISLLLDLNSVIRSLVILRGLSESLERNYLK
jgi:hypothetical protein